jgi:hypothetical protein
MSWWTSQQIHPKTKSRFVVVFGGMFYLPNIKSLNKPKVDFDTKEFRLLNHKFNYPGNGTWQPITMKFVDMNGMGRKQDHFDTGAFLWQIMNNTGYTYPYVDNSQFRDPHFRNVATSGDSIGGEIGGGHHISTKLKLDGKGKSWRTITTPEKSSTIANSFGLGLEDVADFKNASTSKQRISIYQLNDENGISECWHLINPIVKTIGWGDLDYSSDDLVEYELGVVYDWAVMDRTRIGEEFSVSELPYKHFMKTLFVDNEEAIIQKKLDIAGVDLKNQKTKPISSIGDFIDFDGDGTISDMEKRLSQDKKVVASIEDVLVENDRLINEIAQNVQAQSNAMEADRIIEDFSATDLNLRVNQKVLSRNTDSISEITDSQKSDPPNINIDIGAPEQFNTNNLGSASSERGPTRADDLTNVPQGKVEFFTDDNLATNDPPLPTGPSSRIKRPVPDGPEFETLILPEPMRKKEEE